MSVFFFTETFISCVVLQSTVIFSSLCRAICWECEGWGILFLDPDFCYFWRMVVLIPMCCAKKTVHHWTQVLPDRVQLWPSAVQEPSWCRCSNQPGEQTGSCNTNASALKKRSADWNAWKAALNVCVRVHFPQNIESRLKVSLPSDLGAALTDGVVLCHLANHVRPRSVPSIHVPSPAVVSMSQWQRFVGVQNPSSKDL